MVKQYSAEFKLEAAKMVVAHHFSVAKAVQTMGVSLAALNVGLIEGFAIIDKLRAHYPVTTLCQLFERHRSSYRHWHHRMKNAVPDGAQAIKRSLVKEAWNLSGGSAGARTIAAIITTQYGVKMGRYLAGNLMKELGIMSCQHMKHRYKCGAKEHVDIPNLLDCQFAVTAPNQVWCGDVTYIWTRKRWAYLAVVLDLFARNPVGWALSMSPDTTLTLKAP